VVFDTFNDIEKRKFKSLLLHKRTAIQHAYRLLVSRRVGGGGPPFSFLCLEQPLTGRAGCLRAAVLLQEKVQVPWGLTHAGHQSRCPGECLSGSWVFLFHCTPTLPLEACRHLLQAV
jgi:hypothetical protein